METSNPKSLPGIAARLRDSFAQYLVRTAGEDPVRLWFAAAVCGWLSEPERDRAETARTVLALLEGETPDCIQAVRDARDLIALAPPSLQKDVRAYLELAVAGIGVAIKAGEAGCMTPAIWAHAARLRAMLAIAERAGMVDPGALEDADDLMGCFAVPEGVSVSPESEQPLFRLWLSEGGDRWYTEPVERLMASPVYDA